MIYAKHHVRIRGKMYHPGEEIPGKMTDKEWRRLQGLGAIETVHDPVSAVIEEEPQEAEATEAEVSEADTLEGDASEAVEAVAKAVKAAATKAAKAKAAKEAKAAAKAEKQEVPPIAAADLVVRK